MFVTTFLSISMLAMPHELSISQNEVTPQEVLQFNGVTVEIDRNTLSDIRENDIVVVEDFPLGTDDQVTLRLQRFEVFTPDAKVVRGSVNIDGEVLQKQFPRPQVVLLKGAIEGDPSSRVFLAIGEHTTNGLIESDGMTYVVAKDKTRGWTTVYNVSNINPEDMNWTDFHCGVEDAAKPILEKRNRNATRLVGDCIALQVAVDTDYEFTGEIFEGNTAASSEYAVTLMAAMSTIYSADVGVEVHVSFLRLWDTDTDPWDEPDTLGQLPQFRQHWESQMGNIPRHLAHLLSGRSLGGGRAYIGAACSSFGYAVSGNLHGSFPLPLEDHHQNNWDIFVVSHETGHNCGTHHTHSNSYSPVIDGCGNGDCSEAFGGTIMSYCHTCSGGMSNIVLNFHPRVQTTIENYLADITCSLDCDSALIGACCQVDSCTELTLLDCESQGGDFLGSATECAVVSCDPIIGACCIGVEGECDERTSLDCSTLGGTYIGIDTLCVDGWCDPESVSACCFDESCGEMTASDCELSGGFWAGFGTLCSTGGCNPVFNDFCETAMLVSTGVWDFSNVGALTDDIIYDDEDCVSEYLGDMYYDVWFSFVACEDGPLVVSTCDIVNFDSSIVVYEGSCDDMVQVECNGDVDGCAGFTSEVSLDVLSGDSYLIRVGGFSDSNYGNGQILIGGQNCIPNAPCLGDVDENGVVDINDLLIVVDHWGETPDPKDPSILYDVDESGIVDNADLLLIISNWGDCE